MLTRLPEDLLSERVLPLLDTRELILCAAAAHKILPAFAPELHAAFLRRDWKAAGARALRELAPPEPTAEQARFWRRKLAEWAAVERDDIVVDLGLTGTRVGAASWGACRVVPTTEDERRAHRPSAKLVAKHGVLAPLPRPFDDAELVAARVARALAALGLGLDGASILLVAPSLASARTIAKVARALLSTVPPPRRVRVERAAVASLFEAAVARETAAAARGHRAAHDDEPTQTADRPDVESLRGVVIDVGASRTEAVPVVNGRVPEAVHEGTVNAASHTYAELRNGVGGDHVSSHLRSLIVARCRERAHAQETAAAETPANAAADAEADAAIARWKEELCYVRHLAVSKRAPVASEIAMVAAEGPPVRFEDGRFVACAKASDLDHERFMAPEVLFEPSPLLPPQRPQTAQRGSEATMAGLPQLACRAGARICHQRIVTVGNSGNAAGLAPVGPDGSPAAAAGPSVAPRGPALGALEALPEGMPQLVALCGGSTLFPGFERRLRRELLDATGVIRWSATLTVSVPSSRDAQRYAAWHGAARMCREEASRPRAARWLGCTAGASKSGAGVKSAGGADARVATTDEILMLWRHL